MAKADEYFDDDDRSAAEQDKVWTGPRFFGLGIVTIIVAVVIIVYAASTTGCSLQIVP